MTEAQQYITATLGIRLEAGTLRVPISFHEPEPVVRVIDSETWALRSTLPATITSRLWHTDSREYHVDDGATVLVSAGHASVILRYESPDAWIVVQGFGVTIKDERLLVAKV